MNSLMCNIQPGLHLLAPNVVPVADSAGITCCRFSCARAPAGMVRAGVRESPALRQPVRYAGFFIAFFLLVSICFNWPIFPIIKLSIIFGIDVSHANSLLPSHLDANELNVELIATFL